MQTSPNLHNERDQILGYPTKQSHNANKHKQPSTVPLQM